MPDEPAGERQPEWLMPSVLALVHPVDTTAHPTYPPGYRWAVHVGGRPPADLDYCVQAGHAATESAASAIAEMVAAAVVKGLRLLGCPADYGYLRLGSDPVPAEADERPIGIWRGEQGV
jgi:hypothetical protein